MSKPTRKMLEAVANGWESGIRRSISMDYIGECLRALLALDDAARAVLEEFYPEPEEYHDPDPSGLFDALRAALLERESDEP